MPNDQERIELFLAEGEDRIEWRDLVDDRWVTNLAPGVEAEIDRSFAPFSKRAVIVLSAWAESTLPLTAAARAGLGVEEYIEWTKDAKFHAALSFAQRLGLEGLRFRVFGAVRLRDMFQQVTDNILDEHAEYR